MHRRVSGVDSLVDETLRFHGDRLPPAEEGILPLLRSAITAFSVGRRTPSDFRRLTRLARDTLGTQEPETKELLSLQGWVITLHPRDRSRAARREAVEALFTLWVTEGPHHPVIVRLLELAERGRRRTPWPLGRGRTDSEIAQIESEFLAARERLLEARGRLR